MNIRYLDQLGMAAKYNTKVYCRQSLIGGNYGLLDRDTFVPNPDYYRLEPDSRIVKYSLFYLLMLCDILYMVVFGVCFLKVHFCGIDLWGEVFLLLREMLRHFYVFMPIVPEAE